MERKVKRVINLVPKMIEPGFKDEKSIKVLLALPIVLKFETPQQKIKRLTKERKERLKQKRLAKKKAKKNKV